MQVYPISRLTEFSKSPRVSVDAGIGIIVVWADGDNPEFLTLAQAKAIARAKFYAIASAKISALTAEYHPTEQVGWPDKLREARDFEATGDEGLCPNLQEIADLRPGATLQSLVQTVLSKASQLQSQVNLIDAKRGELCDLVAIAATVEEVQSITWEQNNG